MLGKLAFLGMQNTRGNKSMKTCLLTTNALIAFAGAAAAEVSFGGSAEVSYNDLDGFSYDGDVAITGAQELDNGLTAGFTVEFDVTTRRCAGGLVDTFDGDPYVCFSGYTVSLASDSANLTFGDTDNSADLHWSGVSDMAGDSFAESSDNGEDAVLRGEATFGTTTASLSYGVDESSTSPRGLSLAVVADLGMATVVAAYQDADSFGGETYGISASADFAGATVMLAYADNTVDQSTGVSVSYPAGPVTLGASYVSEANAATDDAWTVSADYAAGAITAGASYDSTDDWGLEGSYDASNGIMVYAGVVDAGDDYYVAGTYDLGGGASVLVSYVEDGGAANADNEIGANDYANGTTVTLSIAF
jgi:hypothetical protein